ncbi:MAG: sigma 54-interacting transcriptional regulator [Gammaproteobacteria bacterium]|nr:sigma 54-interacting transcriptional regulator [Gammaproteobacteria bacterium]
MIKPSCLPEITALINAYPQPMALIGRDYRLLALNHKYRQLCGTEQPSADETCYAHSHHYHRPCHEMGEPCPMVAAIKSGEPQRALHLHYTPNGEEHVEVRLYPIKEPHDQVVAFIETARVITGFSQHDNRYAMVGRSPAFLQMLELLNLASPSETTIMLFGESGTGKELAAMAIHQLSPRATAPFVPVECTGLTESLFESELFGHEKGAFTGADRRKEGLVESARGGTLFLDEIGDIPLNQQVKLLRLLETGTYRRVGSSEVQQIAFRLVCATHRNLRQMVEKGAFREDLFYRINAFPVELPPLRQRREDIPLLLDSLLERLPLNSRPRFSAQALACLQQYDFPGNIRELRNIAERATLLAGGDEIQCRHLPAACNREEKQLPKGEGPFPGLIPLAELELSYLRWAERQFQGNRRELAKILGIGERTLYRKLQRDEG